MGEKAWKKNSIEEAAQGYRSEICIWMQLTVHTINWNGILVYNTAGDGSSSDYSTVLFAVMIISLDHQSDKFLENLIFIFMFVSNFNGFLFKRSWAQIAYEVTIQRFE